jgi:hypothetical protein
MFQKTIVVKTLDLRPLVQAAVESPSDASIVKDLTFDWKEYKATSPSYCNRPTPHRIPLSGATPPPADFTVRCGQFLSEAGFQSEARMAGEAGGRLGGCRVMHLAIGVAKLGIADPRL